VNACFIGEIRRILRTHTKREMIKKRSFLLAHIAAPVIICLASFLTQLGTKI
jgi:hypothetical protein